MLGGAPARPQLLPDLPGRVREGGRRLDPPLLRQGIASLAGELPVGERLLAGFLQRDQGESTEPELGSAAADREALDPAPAARGPHIEIEALAVTIASGLAHVAHEGRRQGVVGMPSARLCVAGVAWGVSYIPIYPPQISGCKGMERIDMGQERSLCIVISQYKQVSYMRYGT